MVFGGHFECHPQVETKYIPDFFGNIIIHSTDITMETSDDSFSTSFLQDVLQLNGTSVSNVCDQASESLNFSAFEVADVTERLGHYHKLRQLVEAIEEKEASTSEDISSFSPALTSTWSPTHLVQCLTEAQPEVLDNSVDISDASIAEEPMSSSDVVLSNASIAQEPMSSSDVVLPDASIDEEPMSSEEIFMNDGSQNVDIPNWSIIDHNVPIRLEVPDLTTVPVITEGEAVP